MRSFLTVFVKSLFVLIHIVGLGRGAEFKESDNPDVDAHLHEVTSSISQLSVAVSLPSEPAIHDLVFDDVVGLGDCCLTRLCLNGVFSPTQPQWRTPDGKSHLFDWMRIVSYDGLVDALNHSLEGIFDLENLEVGNHTFHPAIRHQRYQFLWPHLFDSGIYKGFYNKENFNEAALIEVHRADSIPQKIRYLAVKFLALANQTTLYVLSNIRVKQVSNATLADIRNALATCRRNQSEDPKPFSLLVISDTTGLSSFENVIVTPANHKRNKEGRIDWDSGNVSRWNDVLSQFHYG